ncbi:MAG: hypothetical protein HQK51_19145 [Oligoflexia bacterium]|nr:hypothetical protein [Oligoflexia bacterium]
MMTKNILMNDDNTNFCHKSCEKLNESQKIYGFDIINLSDYLDFDTKKSIDQLVNNTSNKNLETISYMQFPVGKMAQFDFGLAAKKLFTPELSGKSEFLFRRYIKNIITTVSIGEKIIKKYKPTVVITFGEYGHYQGIRHAAKLCGVKSISIGHPMHYNADFSRFLMWPRTNEAYFYPHCQNWHKIKNKSIESRYVDECWNDVMFRLFSKPKSHIFSPRKSIDPESIFIELKLKRTKKTALVFTSSYDERHAKDIVMDIWKEGPKISDTFPDQISWLEALREYSTKHNDIQFVIRIHPREGHRQFGFDSEHLIKLKSIFRDNYENFVIIWPDDPISSYDLLEFADICLVSWSLMGQEAARLGIPVLTITGNMFYPDDDFVRVSKSKEGYFNNLKEVLDFKFTYNHLLKAIRFYHWRTFIPSLDLGETVPSKFSDDTFWPESPSDSSTTIIDTLLEDKSLITYNIEKWNNQENLRDLSKEELSSTLKGIRIFIDAIFYPPSFDIKKEVSSISILYNKIKTKILHNLPHVIKSRLNLRQTNIVKEFRDYELQYFNENWQITELIKITEVNKKLRIIAKDGLFTILVHNGKVLRRMSPMINKLAEIHHNASISLDIGEKRKLRSIRLNFFE